MFSNLHLECYQFLRRSDETDDQIDSDDGSCPRSSGSQYQQGTSNELTDPVWKLLLDRVGVGLAAITHYLREHYERAILAFLVRMQSE